MGNIMEKLELTAQSMYCKKVEELTPSELHLSLGKAVMGEIAPNWEASKAKHNNNRRAYYFSAEFLMGRMMYNNLYCLGILDDVKKLLKKKGVDINVFEDIDDAALGNGGLGRLAACYLDSAATQEVPLDGYGIRYKYGLFKQLIKDGYQVEVADNWQRFEDPWCLRREDEAVLVSFKDQTVRAIPYDMAVIGCKTSNINTLRLWQAEAVNDFDFTAFNDTEYDKAVKEKNDAENITKVLYPNDNKYEGKVLRLKQQYFFCSASLQDIMRRYKAKHGNDFSYFAKENAIQLNDTHPVSCVPELVRLLMLENMNFDEAFEIARKTCAYTNHTVLGEALEKWPADLMTQVVPEIYHIICLIANKCQEELTAKGISEDMKAKMRIVDGNVVHMARLATYASTYVNGVAQLHTEILKDDVLKEWYQVYPERFQNKTNGITQRRWLGLCNPELAAMITDKVGSDEWLTDLSLISKLNESVNDTRTINKFNTIKKKKKVQLAEYIKKMDGYDVNPDTIFDIQVKRLHEYKRQLLNAFSIMTIYYRLKENKLKNWTPTTFIFGAKAAPGYARAKAIIKYINEIANLVNNDPDTKDLLQVYFISNYNVSYAEKIVVAADISEQTSTAGLEASGTGNMKFMLNGAVTLGTYDGANIEIAECAGEENEYIFGARVEDIEKLKAEGYDPKKLYDANPEIKRVVDTLIDGTFDDDGAQGEGSFKELHDSLLKDSSWQKADNYFLIYDLPLYVDAKIKANADYADRKAFGKKCLMNIANAGKFSSDRAIVEYAKEIWHVSHK
ncbi:MAG: glycogen/starch/alpha-glucan phosphorylase [Ruminococcus bromii]|nr:glycogen/starch/alpha-glucan phosphorylase [Ruminococcus bromii]MCI7210689.1 glycogen/starch/alpha-glucan phosphorylase [Ruminococcus bromii]MDD6433641.1 glycogen/starch/alpha-glucan phosphorylase [Ruminococcus bromii]MDY4084588.1 glycogen/starch/alpha-glucan phosphorylase [Ruminococcus bromii]MDY4711990.1 glycogen/starch/alpha-glucan phosphorylase [Ruminococcus bromii]